LVSASRSCHNKCISARYAEADLNKGESVCIDRCVAKFNEVQKKVGEKLQNRGAAAAGGGGSAFGSL
jgi:import inner membrane translocase subunit TIM10